MKMKIVLTTTDSSAKRKALKSAAGMEGVYLVEWINEGNEVVVLAEDVDAFCVISQMKKKVKSLRIVSVDSSIPGRRREPQQEQTWIQPPQLRLPRREPQQEQTWIQPPQMRLPRRIDQEYLWDQQERQALPWPPNF